LIRIKSFWDSGVEGTNGRTVAHGADHAAFISVVRKAAIRAREPSVRGLHGNLTGLQERLRQNVDLDHFASRGVNLLKLAMTY
jgi:hypothetical protein